MSHATAVCLIRQTGALPLLEELHAAGAPTERLLRESQLPESFEEARDGFIPFRTMLHFAGRSAQSQDIPDLCWRGVLETGMTQLGKLCTGGVAAAVVSKSVEVVGLAGACPTPAGRLNATSLRSIDHRTHLSPGGRSWWRTA